MRIKICVIYNYAQHYRLAIFQLLNKELGCDFYFGDKMKDVRKLDYKLLPGFKKELKNVKVFSNAYWQKGAVSLFFSNYKTYLVLGEYYCLSTWVLLILTKFSSKKIYLWSHGWYGNENRLKRIIKKFFFNLSDHVFLYGNYARDLMINEGFSSEKLDVIYNSLYYSHQIEIRDQLKNTDIYSNYFHNEDPVIIFIGRLTIEKKLSQLLLAQDVLAKNHIPVNLVFVGTGTEEADLRMQAETSGNLNCWFYGPCYDERKIGELIYNATVCVSPGNVGLTAMHAMVFGTPVITHDDFTTQMPEFEAIIPGKTGGYFIKDNIGDMVSKIGEWISPAVDRESVRKLCYGVIDEKYNPAFQVSVFKKVIVKDNL
ncbi:MAG: glycosyltransferase [Ferruginibacter sp.]